VCSPQDSSSSWRERASAENCSEEDGFSPDELQQSLTSGAPAGRPADQPVGETHLQPR